MSLDIPLPTPKQHILHCERCAQWPARIHEDAGGTGHWHVMSFRSRPGDWHRVYQSAREPGVWLCSCKNSEFVKRGVEGRCDHIKLVKAAIARNRQLDAEQRAMGAAAHVPPETDDELFDGEEVDAPDDEHAPTRQSEEPIPFRPRSSRDVTPVGEHTRRLGSFFSA